MAVVALTGGIAAGKTVVTDVLIDHGVRVIDADLVAREVVEPGQPALEAIVHRFGPGVLDPSGRLDRPALAERVFNDQAARADLNAIVHPAVFERSHQLFAEHHKEEPGTPVVYAVPLLVESGRMEEFDLIVVVDAPARLRQRRLVDQRGLTDQEAQARIASQATDDQRLHIADVVIDASGDLQHTVAQAHALAEQLASHWPASLKAIPRTLKVSAE